MKRLGVCGLFLVMMGSWEVLASIDSTGISRIYTYEGKLPEGASLRVCVPTPKSILTLPFNLKNIALPQKKGNI